MTLPPVLIDAASALIFEFWERYHAPRGNRQPLRWEQVHPSFQAMWNDITQIALEMGVSVVLNDAERFLDESNGDMGGAFVKALKRYRKERLEP